MQNTQNKGEKQASSPLLSNGEDIDSYTVSNLISIGGFGQVYTCFHRITHQRVAIKVEAITAKIPLLRNEALCLHYLNGRHNPHGSEPREPILRFITYGRTETLKYLVMDHCGANLRELKRATPNDQFSITTSLWIMERMVSALQFIHSHGWLHRDVKPANFCIGDNETHKLYLIDFGMCRYFMNIDGTYKKRRPSSPFHGTLRYASVNSHNKQDLCRWDDLWSVYYIAIENMVGALPWRFITDRAKVAEMKIQYKFNTLQYGEESDMPQPLRILAYHLCQSYQDPDASFYTIPPYGCIIREVAHDLDQRHFYKNSPLDWEVEPRSTRSVADSCGDYGMGLMTNLMPVEQPLYECDGEQSFYCF
ncbi:hypothetical protein Y032_0019g3764 [Ancylostoma ceylanicum]|uniref:Protein kinase domain-containing protein n=1 Tax=Ancylostoma ceylanicum TaxID=53326 RepID=A0A016V0Y7_9BILA|nr:hypothetical protein Y032_0019g3764 [Ancylostoma ceylanicum]